MKKKIIYITAIVLISVIIFNLIPEKGTFEELILPSYKNCTFDSTSIKIYKGLGSFKKIDDTNENSSSKFSSKFFRFEDEDKDINGTNEILDYFKTLELKEKVSVDLTTSHMRYYISIGATYEEYKTKFLFIEIYSDKIIGISYKNSKNKRVDKYFEIIDKNIDFNKINDIIKNMELIDSSGPPD